MGPALLFISALGLVGPAVLRATAQQLGTQVNSGLKYLLMEGRGRRGVSSIEGISQVHSRALDLLPKNHLVSLFEHWFLSSP